MTPYAITIFWVLNTLNNAGQLAPVEKAELPAPYTSPIMFSDGQCFTARGKIELPGEVCLPAIHQRADDLMDVCKSGCCKPDRGSSVRAAGDPA